MFSDDESTWTEFSPPGLLIFLDVFLLTITAAESKISKSYWRSQGIDLSIIDLTVILCGKI